MAGIKKRASIEGIYINEINRGKSFRRAENVAKAKWVVRHHGEPKYLLSRDGTRPARREHFAIFASEIS